MLLSSTTLAQNSIIPATTQERAITIPGLNLNYYHTLNSDYNYNTITNRLCSAVIMDNVNGFVSNELKLMLTDGVSDLTITYDIPTLFAVASYFPVPPTSISNPDIVLTNNAEDAVIVFETDDASYGACWVEIDIDWSIFPATSSVSIVTAPYGGPAPIGLMAANFSYGQYTTFPRIDRSYNLAGDDVIGISVLQDIDLNTFMEPTITYLDLQNFGNIFDFIPSVPPQYTYAPVALAPANIYVAPDIALSYEIGSGDFSANVAVLDMTNITSPTFSYEVKHFSYHPIHGINSVSTATPTTFPWMAGSSTVVLYPRICAPTQYNLTSVFGLGFAPAPFAISHTYIDGASPQLYYYHYDAGSGSSSPLFSSLAQFDDQNFYGTSNNYQTALDWMTDDACVAWPSLVFPNSGGSFVGLFALMNPFLTGNWYDWEQVNFFPTVGTFTKQSISVASCLEAPTSDDYHIVWLDQDKIYIKERPINTTSFKATLSNITAFTFYPNPTNTTLTVISSPKEKFSISAINGASVIDCVTDENGRATIDLSRVSDGIYCIKSSTSSSLLTVKH